MPTLLLVRHGETDWNRTGQIMGEQPVPLNSNGEAQVKRLAGVLESCRTHAIYSSPVVRARQTADILSSALQLPVKVDRGLTEINVGEWVGLFWRDLQDDLTRQNFYAQPQDARPPGGETLREVQGRSVGCIERIVAETAESRAANHRIVFVSHADVVRAILSYYLRWDLQMIRQVRIDHASVTALALGDGLADLLFLNYRPEPQPLKERM